MIKERGADGKLKLEFAGLDVFGTPENTRVIFVCSCRSVDDIPLMLYYTDPRLILFDKRQN